MNTRKWTERAPADDALAEALMEQFDIPHAGARFLIARGLSDAADIRRYLEPSLEDSGDPFQFEHMREAVALVEKAIREKRRILIHGDYDVDGISGTALLYQYLDGLVPNVMRFVPDRRRDGYGIASRMIDWSLENDVGLLIAVDCGTSDGEALGRLEDAGVDVLVCDHHEMPADGGTRGVLLNPSRPEETYPFRPLCGTGVAYKLVQALSESGVSGRTSPGELLDLVALATVGDLSPLVGENRYFVRAGLELMNRAPRPGVAALRTRARVADDTMTAYHLGFVLAPRINAPGRVSQPRPSLEILCATDVNEARDRASHLEVENERRRELTREVETAAVQQVRAMPDGRERGGFVLSAEGWDEGVLGIAAARVVEEFGRPAVLVTIKDGVAKGSGRSIPGVNLKEQLDHFHDCFNRYGGHAQACGLTMPAGNLERFSEGFNARLREFVTPGDGLPLKIDSSLALEECSDELLGFLARCEPFGYGNKTPVWRISDVQVLPSTGFVGTNHLKLFFQDTRGNPGEAIAFNWTRPETPDDLHGRAVDIAVTVRKSTYMKRTYPELRVVDIRYHQPA